MILLKNTWFVVWILDGYVAGLNPITFEHPLFETAIRGVLVAVGNPVPVNEYQPVDGREYPLGTDVGVAKQVISHE